MTLTSKRAPLTLRREAAPLADGYSALLFVLRGDLEFLSNHFRLNHPSSNTPCFLCRADRQMQSRPWTDCRLNAAWRSTCWTAAQWAEEHPQCHPLLSMPGSGLDVIFPDLMHLKHLGTDQLLLGSILIWMIKHFLPGTQSENLDLVWDFIQSWWKDG